MAAQSIHLFVKNTFTGWRPSAFSGDVTRHSVYDKNRLFTPGTVTLIFQYSIYILSFIETYIQTCWLNLGRTPIYPDLWRSHRKLPTSSLCFSPGFQPYTESD